MDSISYTPARAHLAKNMDKVCEDHAPLAITRKYKDAVVMMSTVDYPSLAQTTYLLRSPENAWQLMSAIGALAPDVGTDVS